MVASDEIGKEVADGVDLKAVGITEHADSLTMILALKVSKDVEHDHRVYVHIYPDSTAVEFLNRDFAPTKATTTWKKGDIVLCRQTLPMDCVGAIVHLGLFRNQQYSSSGLRFFLQ